MTVNSHRRSAPGILAFLALISLASLADAQVLPPPPARLTMPAQLFVREFRFEGNTVFSSAELTKVTATFTNRSITTDELEDARRAVTVYYISHGYINSGATVPDQDPEKGVILIRIVEGTLSTIEMHTNRWLRDDYITSRLRRWSGPPLNMNDLKEGLQILRQNPNVKQIKAELKPGAAPGEGILDMRVTDEQPFRLGLEIDNHRPPSDGSEEISLVAADLNLTGHSDPLDLKYGIANSGADQGWGFSGLDNIEGSYTLPLNRYDTTFGVRGSRYNSSIVERPFGVLGIESETGSYGGVLRQPLFQTANRELAVSVAFDREQNNTTLLGAPFTISPGAVNGRMTVSALRLSQEWIDRGQNHVLALRSTFNVGLDVLDATDNGVPGDPNATFFSWLGQGQYVRRLFNTQNEFIFRVATQLTGDRLLALEQMSIGGANTVRGYRENQLVRDRGVISSLEFHLPVLFDKTGAGIVQLAPFFDFGGGWNNGGSPSPTTIYSTGVGLLLAPNKHFNAQLYWGYRLRHVPNPHNDPQDLGLSFQVNIAAF
jgi:hemolysin activation/secretion protein